MNKTCQLYLGTYSHIESIDDLIKTFHMKYRYWNFWYSPIIRDMYLVVVFDYGMYLKAAEGDLDHTWKYDNIVDFWKFCDLVSNKMLKHRIELPVNYPVLIVVMVLYYYV